MNLDDLVVMPAHPARYSDEVWDAIAAELAATDAPIGAVAVDPFAGTGQRLDAVLHYGFTPVGVELEPEWAQCSPFVRQGDARRLPMADESVHVVFTSPAYGNRLADKYRTDATADTVLSYAQKLGRNLSDGNGGALQWGEAYRQLHRECIAEWWRVLVPGGKVIVNISDHERDRKLMHVTSWWVTALLGRGFLLRRASTVGARRFRRGRNGQRRAPGEQVLVFAKPHPDFEEL